MFREQYVSTDVSKSGIVGKRTARKIVCRHFHNPARIRLTVVHTLLLLFLCYTALVTRVSGMFKTVTLNNHDLRSQRQFPSETLNHPITQPSAAPHCSIPRGTLLAALL